MLRNPSQGMAASGGHAGHKDRSKPLASDWSAAAWLASVGIEQLLAGVLLGEDFGKGDDELKAMRTLGRLDRLEDELSARLVAGLGPLVALLALPALPAGADDIDESSAARNVKSLLQADPGEDLSRIWKLSESLAALGRPAIAPLRKVAPEADAPRRLAIGRALGFEGLLTTLSVRWSH